MAKAHGTESRHGKLNIADRECFDHFVDYGLLLATGSKDGYRHVASAHLSERWEHRPDEIARTIAASTMYRTETTIEFQWCISGSLYFSGEVFV